MSKARTLVAIVIPVVFALRAPLFFGLAIFQPLWLLAIPVLLVIFGAHTVISRRKRSRQSAEM